MFDKLNASIKRQLFFSLACFTLLLCMGYTGVAALVAYVTEDAVLESILQHEAKTMQAAHAKFGEWQQPRASYMQLVLSFAQLPKALKPTVQAANQRNALKSEIFTELADHYHVIRLTNDKTGAYLIAEVSPFLVVSRLSKNLADFMLMVALMMLAGALLLAYHLAHRIAAPLMQLNAEVKSHAAMANPAPFTSAKRVDEIGFLARSLEHSLHSLQSALRREAMFTRDISHELRTPVTIIQNLLYCDTNLADSTDQKELLKASMQEIDNTISTLLALARAENMQLQRIDLLPGIEQAILLLEKTARAHGLSFNVDFDEATFEQEYLAMANPHLLNLLFNNLFSNALFHGGDQVRIALRLEVNRLIISNSITSPTSQRLHGFGHGKNLLQRIAESLNWHIEFLNLSTSFEVVINLRPSGGE